MTAEVELGVESGVARKPPHLEDLENKSNDGGYRMSAVEWDVE